MSPACRSLGCDVCFVDVDGLMPTKAMMDDGWIGWMTAVVCGCLWARWLINAIINRGNEPNIAFDCLNIEQIPLTIQVFHLLVPTDHTDPPRDGHEGKDVRSSLSKLWYHKRCLRSHNQEMYLLVDLYFLIT